MPGEVPSGWQRSALGQQLAAIRGGGTPPRDVSAFWNGPIPWASVKDITAGLRTGTQESITEAGLRESASSVAPAGTVVLATRMAVGKSIRFTVDVAINQDLKALIPQPTLSADFLHAWLHAHEERIAATATGSTVKGIRVEYLEAMTLLLPPLPEQKKIAAILSSVDEAIQATQAVIDQTRRVKEGLLQDLLTRGLPGHTRFKQTEIGESPESWEVRHVGSLGKVKGGKRLPAGSKYPDSPTPFRYIRVSDFAEGTVTSGSVKCIDADAASAIKRYTISSRDIYISIAGTLGVVGTVPAELDGAFLTENAAKIVLIPVGPVCRDFLQLVLASDIGQRQVKEETGTGAGVPKLALFRIESILVPVPPMAEQESVCKIVSGVSAVLEKTLREHEELAKLKAGLLQDLLTGKVRVTP